MDGLFWPSMVTSSQSTCDVTQSRGPGTTTSYLLFVLARANWRNGLFLYIVLKASWSYFYHISSEICDIPRYSYPPEPNMWCTQGCIAISNMISVSPISYSIGKLYKHSQKMKYILDLPKLVNEIRSWWCLQKPYIFLLYRVMNYVWHFFSPAYMSPFVNCRWNHARYSRGWVLTLVTAAQD